ncbi:SAM-dependent methyltransferase [Streptomyces albus]|nr:SAM-dependent methyltransferase [Streptomyces albus]
MGEMTDRTERDLTAADLGKIADTYHAWRGTQSAHEEGVEYADELGFCLSADLATVREHGYVLTPGRYVGAIDVEEEDAKAVAERIAKLTGELYELFDKSDELSKTVREQLGRVNV